MPSYSSWENPDEFAFMQSCTPPEKTNNHALSSTSLVKFLRENLCNRSELPLQPPLTEKRTVFTRFTPDYNTTSSDATEREGKVNDNYTQTIKNSMPKFAMENTQSTYYGPQNQYFSSNGARFVDGRGLNYKKGETNADSLVDYDISTSFCQLTPCTTHFNTSLAGGEASITTHNPPASLFTFTEACVVKKEYHKYEKMDKDNKYNIHDGGCFPTTFSFQIDRNLAQDFQEAVCGYAIEEEEKEPEQFFTTKQISSPSLCVSEGDFLLLSQKGGGKGERPREGENAFEPAWFHNASEGYYCHSNSRYLSSLRENENSFILKNYEANDISHISLPRCSGEVLQSQGDVEENEKKKREREGSVNSACVDTMSATLRFSAAGDGEAPSKPPESISRSSSFSSSSLLLLPYTPPDKIIHRGSSTMEEISWMKQPTKPRKARRSTSKSTDQYYRHFEEENNLSTYKSPTRCVLFTEKEEYVL
ncbi:unnamed protein product [Phytomonas sp. Hart1]|nr:unnamed protein product [Phytomonas sp. Hart1]|eukprot:CCW71607.1 unnamed protein product [Phytomonas sp. isolate Hart1]